MVEEDLDGDCRVVTDSGERQTGVEIILLKHDVATTRTVTPRVVELIGAQVQCGDCGGGKVLSQQFGDTAKPAAQFQNLFHRQTSRTQDIDQKAFLDPVVI